jgi:hypothetical protein
VGDSSGFSVSSAGDVNGDGLDDLIVGAPFAKPDGTLESGKSYVVFGKVGFTCVCSTTWIGSISAHNQIIQAIAVDIACAGD